MNIAIAVIVGLGVVAFLAWIVREKKHNCTKCGAPDAYAHTPDGVLCVKCWNETKE